MRRVVFALNFLCAVAASAQVVSDEVVSDRLQIHATAMNLAAPAVALAKDKSGVAIAWSMVTGADTLERVYAAVEPTTRKQREIMKQSRRILGAIRDKRGMRVLRSFGSLQLYQRPYAELIKLGRWSGTLRARTSDTPFEIADRFGRQVPRAHTAIGDATAAYVEGTYSTRPPARDPWPEWLAARRAVIRGLFSRRLGGWFGVDESVAPPPRGHPELLS